MDKNDRRKLLRDRTNHLHKQLDETVGELHTSNEYFRYLKGMFLFRQPTEKQVLTSAETEKFKAFVPTFISGEIEYDLRSLNLFPITTPDHDTALQPLDLSQLLGVLYVLEGSSLGAKLLIKRAEKLGFGVNNGASHLTRQTSVSGNWKALCTLLEQTEAVDEEAMTSAALTTFVRAMDAFEKV